MTGSFSQNAARKPSGTEKHHIAPIFPCISNFASPPAQKMPSRTVVLTDCAHQVQTAEEKHVLQIFCRGIGKRSEVDDCRRDQHQKTAGHNADGNCKMRQRPPYSRAFSSSSAPSRFPIRTPAPPLTPRIRQERRLLAIEVIEFAATASLPICPMITEYRT